MKSTFVASIRNSVDEDTLRAALAAVFSRPVSDIGRLADLSEEYQPMIMYTEDAFDAGDFRARIQVDLTEPLWSWGDSLTFGLALAKELNQEVLGSAAQLTDAPSGLFRALIKPDGSTFLVVDDEDDDGNQYLVEDTIQPAARIR